VTEEQSVTEGEKAQLQKGLSWLEAGMPEPKPLSVREWSFPWQ